ncbi:hypothetical protein PICMEDRAFT_74615 [Pichia membranifaciens NRRL Y-2026]|uniref:Uncharacterized protein n=1 Tax=Pichia membranifaciens NRRL Y-2026 TaxID=763406 RepID=A0A1E3NE20_9ASCO|nr:hypothetical protein PICMEDRAFT_74615 [Pichia membranifaciens NRRL Y-2026]ODQ44369.1 hypothetical protein PICMEDRAFT_74615 [Pichia membranifaciens NRRL Y-2026]
MGKLVVQNFRRLHEVRLTRFYRIIGMVTEYDPERGVVGVISIFDGSRCEVELDLECDADGTKRLDFHEGLVVDINAVTVSAAVLKASRIDVVNLPGSLIEYRETLCAFAQIGS